MCPPSASMLDNERYVRVDAGGKRKQAIEKMTTHWDREPGRCTSFWSLGECHSTDKLCLCKCENHSFTVGILTWGVSVLSAPSWPVYCKWLQERHTYTPPPRLCLTEHDLEKGPALTDMSRGSDQKPGVCHILHLIDEATCPLDTRP